MATQIDVLAVIGTLASIVRTDNGNHYSDINNLLVDAETARAAVAELIEKSRRLEITANTLRYCYSKQPGNFASCFQQLDEDAAEMRAALARIRGAA